MITIVKIDAIDIGTRWASGSAKLVDLARTSIESLPFSVAPDAAGKVQFIDKTTPEDKAMFRKGFTLSRSSSRGALYFAADDSGKFASCDKGAKGAKSITVAYATGLSKSDMDALSDRPEWRKIVKALRDAGLKDSADAWSDLVRLVRKLMLPASVGDTRKVNSWEVTAKATLGKLVKSADVKRKKGDKVPTREAIIAAEVAFWSTLKKMAKA